MRDARVLIVDDDSNVRRLLAEAFTRAGVAADEASDGREAIELCRRQTYGIIVLDLRMPHVDGAGVAAYLKQLDAERPIAIVITGHVMEYDGALDPDIVDLIVRKPLDAGALAEIVAGALQLLEDR